MPQLSISDTALPEDLRQLLAKLKAAGYNKQRTPYFETESNLQAKGIDPTALKAWAVRRLPSPLAIQGQLLFSAVVEPGAALSFSIARDLVD